VRDGATQYRETFLHTPSCELDFQICKPIVNIIGGEVPELGLTQARDHVRISEDSVLCHGLLVTADQPPRQPLSARWRGQSVESVAGPDQHASA